MTSIDDKANGAQDPSTGAQDDDYRLAMEQYNEIWYNLSTLTRIRIKRMITQDGGNPKSRTQRWVYTKALVEAALDDFFLDPDYQAGVMAELMRKDRKPNLREHFLTSFRSSSPYGCAVGYCLPQRE